MKWMVCLLTVLAALNAFAGKPSGLLFEVTGSPHSIDIVTTAEGHTYPNAGIKLLTPGFSFADGFSFSGGCASFRNGFCLFSVSDTDPKHLEITGDGTLLKVEVCLDAKGPLSCQIFTLQTRIAYFTNGSFEPTDHLIWRCELDSETGEIDTCSDAAADSAVNDILAGSGGLNGIAINHSIQTLYATQVGNDSCDHNVYRCKMDSNGYLAACGVDVVDAPDYYSYYGEMTLNSTGSLAYLINSAESTDSVTVCPVIDPARGILSNNCTDAGVTILGNGSVQITLDKTNSHAYIGSYADPSVTVCKVSANGKTFTGCVNKTGNGSTVTFDAPSGVALTPSGDLLYIADYHTNKVYFCSAGYNASTTFNACDVAASGFSNLNAIAISQDGKHAYLTSFDAVTYTCDINSEHKFETPCLSNATPNGAIGVALTP